MKVEGLQIGTIFQFGYLLERLLIASNGEGLYFLGEFMFIKSIKHTCMLVIDHLEILRHHI